MDTADNSTPNKTIPTNNLLAEIKVILDFMYHKGIKLPDNLSTQSLTENDTDINPTSLTADYNAVIAAILPSTPESIEFIGNEFEGKIADLRSWKIPVVKKYIALSIVALIGLICFSLMPNVTAENQEKGILALQGFPLLENLGVILFASLLGVMFFVLKTIKDKIDDFTLVPVDIFSFNISIMIGIVSGFIISELFTFTTTIMGSSVEVHKMTLALLGGFASDAIFSILQNIVNKVKTLFAE
ncbi:MAG TPA: hypothetical protein PKD51_07660 [Saprospiraceae bacterium]|nr:hypothetical protein [Saprospiraceae bacterium]